uniref:Transmembrane protein n=1 Tax=Dunaliella tertiolecta TaxID=3047 RepID=A0A7S3QRF9_DUNTE|mmetsp:Transcript_29084/g.78354  ORF Transcript_29084/g.78354 Transcript_29084/m.78354 type:complete len:846 (-) Transcript_29084:1089-3626(-)
MPRLLVLAVLLCCSLLCKPLLALEECPCWAEPDSTTGECSDKQLPLVYSSREFAETYTQCVDRVTYDAEYGALQASLCWNRACLPERFQSQTVTAELNLGADELEDMSEGNYTSNFKGQPSLDGIRLRTSVSAFKQREQGVEEVSVQGDNATFTVPEGGLTRLKIAWEWPSQLNASAAGSNQAFVVMRNSSLSNVPLTWPGLPNSGAARNLSSIDLCASVQAVGLETSGKSCGKGKIELWVTRANTGFVGVNPNNLRPATENVAALMCVDPPKYDRYTQLLEWGFAWDFDCWESRAVPFVFQMGEVPSNGDIRNSGLDGLGMPTNARMKLLTRGDQVYRMRGEESPLPSLIPFFSVRKVNTPYFDGFGGFETFIVTNDDFTFHFPKDGITSFALSSQIWGPYENATPGEVKYLGLVTVPGTDMGGISKLKDKHTIIDYNVTYAIKGQRLDEEMPWASVLGVRASVQAVGWGITVPVLLRNRRVLPSCDDEDVDTFLQRLANVTAIERSHLNATCLELPPGQAIGYTEHLLGDTVEPSYTVEVPNMGGQPSLKRCTDARLGLNITYNTLLPLEVRPGPESTQGPSESELGRPYIPPSDTAEAVLPIGASSAKTSRAKSALKLKPEDMPQVHPIKETEGKKRRLLLQDGNTQSPPIQIEARLQQAALNMSALFIEEEFGGSEQYCVYPTGIVSTLVMVKDSILRSKKVAEEGGTPVIPREGDRIIIGNQKKMERICKSTIDAAVERLEVFLGQEKPVDVDVVHMIHCYGETNCVDCWPYEVLEVYQIVLIVCAFCLSVIVILGVRAYMVMSVANLNKTLRPGYLNDEGTIERLIREQEELDYDDLVD